MQKTNETRNGFSNVAGKKIRYTWTNNYGENAQSVRGEIMDGESRFGGLTAEADGRLYISFDKSGIIDTADRHAIVDQIIDDVESIFNNKKA